MITKERETNRELERVMIGLTFIGRLLLVFSMFVLMVGSLGYLVALPNEFISLLQNVDGHLEISSLTVIIFHVIDVILIITFALMTVLIIFHQYVYRSKYITREYPWAENLTHSDLKVKIADALVAITSIKLLGYAVAVGTSNLNLLDESTRLIVLYSAGLHTVLLLSALIVKFMHLMDVWAMDKRGGKI